MVDKVGILIEETSVSTGTGNFTLASKISRRTFNQGYGLGGTDKFLYFITNRAVDEWEHGTGHLLDATTLVRDTVIQSSNGDTLVVFSTGTKDVISDLPFPVGNAGQVLVSNGTGLRATFKDLTPSSFVTEIFTDPADFTAGTSTSVTLSITPVNEDAVFVHFKGGYQDTTDISLAGNVLSFSPNIPSFVDKIEVRIHVPGTLG